MYYRARYYDPGLELFLSQDPLGNAQRYVNGNPLLYSDPLGLDGILINFEGFPVTVGKISNFRVQLPLGHAGVVSVDPKSGRTRFYQYGRYNGSCGKVLRERVPDLVIGKDGKPTPQSLKNLYEQLSKNQGQGVPVSGTYYKNADYNKINNFAETRMKNPDCWQLGNTCRDFAEDAIDAAP